MDHNQSGTSSENSRATEQYMCSDCYRTRALESIAPQGFEDVTSIKEVRARARELGIDIGGKLKQENDVFEQTPQKHDTTHEPRT
jgi:hypothetical protein